MEYIKENNQIYQVITTKTLIDLTALKAEFAGLKAMAEPSDKELAEMGKSMHPYYTQKQDQITYLTNQIAEIETAVGVVK